MLREHNNDPRDATHMFTRLLALSCEAHTRRQHEVAYHALTAALHAAQDATDVDALRSVATEAQTQIDWINRHAPNHRLSTLSAGRHHHPGVYALLMRQADAIGSMIEVRK